ncbi:MAG: hypothetical protein COA79_00460 [Planctomycetota bacterium]|nr:MAG: hypothetical protein COA79_00460 [Planctomycetota bacterium]
MIKINVIVCLIIFMNQLSLFPQDKSKNTKKLPFQDLNKENILYSNPQFESLKEMMRKNNIDKSKSNDSTIISSQKFIQEIKKHLEMLTLNYLDMGYSKVLKNESAFDQLKKEIVQNTRKLYPLKNGRFIIEWTKNHGKDEVLKLNNIKSSLITVKYLSDWKIQILANESTSKFSENKSIVFGKPNNVGEVVYVINSKGDFTIGIISSIKMMKRINHDLQFFRIISVSPIDEGAFIFNKNNKLIGINYLIDNQNIIISAKFIESKILPYTKKIPRKYGIGVYGKMVLKGFEILKNLNASNKLKKGDLVLKINNLKCSQENNYQLKNIFTKEQECEVLILRDEQKIKIKIKRFQFTSNILEESSKQTINLWLDPLDKNSLKIAKTFIDEIQTKFSDIKIKVMYFRLDHKDLYQWLEVSRIIQYGIDQNNYKIIDWLIKNKRDEKFKYFSKIESDLKLKNGILKKNMDEHKFKELIENCITVGMLNFDLKVLPALSFKDGKTVEFSTSGLDSLLDLYLTNCL